jgi:hypothetical protein
MGIQVELRVADERVRRLPDPAGGFFDAAGNFDRLIPRGSPALRLLGEVDPYGETCFGSGQMQDLVAEVELLIARAMAGAEHPGLMRLRVMALHCASEGAYPRILDTGFMRLTPA